MTRDDLLNLIQNAEKLQNFTYRSRGFERAITTNIDADLFREWEQIVDRRCEKTKLNLYLDSATFTSNIPPDLTSNLLTLAIR